jgi:FixJ family two-component response regulator
VSDAFDLSDESFNGPRHAPPVVFVDDDELVLKAIARLFQFQPYEALTFRDPKEALEFIRERAVQVLVSDLRMPEIDGLELLRQAQEANPDAVRVVLSAYSDRESLLDAINNGNIYRYILKPWDAVELISVVRQSADLYNLRRENQRLAEALRSVSVHDVVGKIGSESRGVTLLERYGAYVASELSRPVDSFQRVASLGKRASSEQRIPRSELMTYLSTVESAVQELEAIRRDLIDDALLVGLAREMDLDLNTAIQRVAGELAENRGGLPMKLEEHLAEDTPAVVASPILLSRLLTEVLTFAVDHAADRGGANEKGAVPPIRLVTQNTGNRAVLEIECTAAVSEEQRAQWQPLIEKLALTNGAALTFDPQDATAPRIRLEFPGAPTGTPSAQSTA